VPSWSKHFSAKPSLYKQADDFFKPQPHCHLL
jgi:hypothetical protein